LGEVKGNLVPQQYQRFVNSLQLIPQSFPSRNTSQMRSTKILPGSTFPTISLPNGNGSGNLSLNSENGRHKLVVVYRGQFCPFCAGKIIKYQITSTSYTYMMKTNMQHAYCMNLRIYSYD
jgi:hypothetical protein